MDKVWFHHCITGLLSLSGIQRNDLLDICERFPYQANMRFILGQKAKSNQSKVKSHVVADALDVPDRQALFLQNETGPFQNNIEVSQGLHAENATVGSEATDKINPKAERLLSLPKYVKPETSLDEFIEVEDELADLEDRLLANISEDYINEQQNTMDMSERGNNPQPPKMPILDRIDKSLNPSAFGFKVTGKSLLNVGFIQWLDQFNHSPQIQITLSGTDNLEKWPDLESKDDMNEDGATPHLKASSDIKKKKKKRKAAKLLAKASVKKSNEIATETLAELLGRQGHIEEAIAMFERLILLFPEKKSTFAAQIAKIKRKQI